MGICCAKPAPKVSLVADPYHPSLAMAEPAVPPSPNTPEKKKKKKKAKAPEQVNGTTPVPTGNGEVKPVEKPVEAEPQATKEEVVPEKQVAEAEPEENPEVEAPKEDPGAKHPDFSGDWLMTAYEGDAEKFMLDLGFGWALRKLAKSLGMGVNKTKSEIKHDLVKNTLSYKNTDAQNKVSSIFIEVNGTEQKNTVDGNDQFIKPVWSEDGQSIEATGRDQKGPTPSSKRYLVSPTEMRVKLTTSKGTIFEQIFTKQ
mmetsp:Transcript_1751/g.3256  ORF Transcript_1751/g.3256 Transcript_1751/m.3256 type:complete len:256 (-) Transcript_1751:66-833(-)